MERVPRLPSLIGTILVASALGWGPSAAALPVAQTQAAPQAAPNSIRLEYLKRADQADGAAAHVELARWCESKGLAEEMRRELERALVYDPKNRPANEKLGNKLYAPDESLLSSAANDGELDPYAGRWITPEEQALVAKLEAAVRARAKEMEERAAADPWEREAATVVRNVKSDAVFRLFKLTPTVRKPYVVFVEGEDAALAKETGAEIASYLCDLHRYFLKRFDGMLHATDRTPVFKFVLFADRKGFDEYNEKHKKHGNRIIKPPGKEVRAFYHNGSHEILSYRESATDVSMLAAPGYSKTFHEAVHQLRAAYTTGGADAYQAWTLWWNEGIAEYIAPAYDEAAVRSHQHRYESVHAIRALEFQAALRSEKYIPLFDLLRFVDMDQLQRDVVERFKIQPNDIEEEIPRYSSLFYAEAWSFLYFLNHYENGKYRDVFQRYCKLELDGSGDRMRLQELFGFKNRADWEEIEKQWIAFVKAMPLK